MKLDAFYYFWEFLAEMTSKELRARYKKTSFGFLWMIINPILQMLVIGLVFSFFVKNQVDNYFMFLFIGLLTWSFFTLSLTKCTPSIFDQRGLIKKAYFPRLVIPLAILLSNYIHYIISLGLLLIVLLFVGKFTFTSLIYLLLTQIALLIFTIGLSLFTTAINVRFRDVNFFVQALLILWFYATPIVYPLSFIPEQYRGIWYINPLTGIIQLLQHIAAQSQLPDLNGFIANLLTSFVFLLIGVFIFQRESKNFDDWI